MILKRKCSEFESRAQSTIVIDLTQASVFYIIMPRSNTPSATLTEDAESK